MCATTIFNMHWVCHRCGFGVCLDCYNLRVQERERQSGKAASAIISVTSDARGTRYDADGGMQPACQAFKGEERKTRESQTDDEATIALLAFPSPSRLNPWQAERLGGIKASGGGGGAGI